MKLQTILLALFICLLAVPAVPAQEAASSDVVKIDIEKWRALYAEWQVKGKEMYEQLKATYKSVAGKADPNQEALAAEGIDFGVIRDMTSSVDSQLKAEGVDVMQMIKEGKIIELLKIAFDKKTETDAALDGMLTDMEKQK